MYFIGLFGFSFQGKKFCGVKNFVQYVKFCTKLHVLFWTVWISLDFVARFQMLFKRFSPFFIKSFINLKKIALHPYTVYKIIPKIIHKIIPRIISKITRKLTVQYNTVQTITVQAQTSIIFSQNFSTHGTKGKFAGLILEKLQW